MNTPPKDPKVYHTTKEHYQKYAAMVKHAGLTWNGTLPGGKEKKFQGYTRDELIALYRADENLNNIPMSKFDALYPFMRPNFSKPAWPFGLSMAENVCLYKHFIIMHIIGCTFVEKTRAEVIDEINESRKRSGLGSYYLHPRKEEE